MPVEKDHEKARNLDEYNAGLTHAIERTKAEVTKARQEKGYVSNGSYFLDRVSKSLHATVDAVSNELFGVGVSVDEVEIRPIDRERFGGDITVGVPSLIKKIGFPEYVSKLLPNVLEKLLANDRSGFSEWHLKGMYLNLLLRNAELAEIVRDVLVLGNAYGDNDSSKGKNVVVDYSSPNVAKHLHAGHIRSTIIGKILSNIYEANGYAVHEINYINDWGGMGYIIEWFRRWESVAMDPSRKNDFLAKIYGTYRLWQKYSASEETFGGLSESDRAELVKYVGEFSSFSELRERYAEYESASKAAFSRLESGDAETFAVWRKLVAYSLEDFEGFYDLLRVHHPYLVGESHYSKMGKELVRELVREWSVVFFDAERAGAEKARLAAAHGSAEISDARYAKVLEEIDADVGSYVVMLSNFERYVVLKGDESTIYATRDLSALKDRMETFSPSMIVYEVGQEQGDHFNKLFESARTLGLDRGTAEFHHVYHGFYVSETTKKKLSSREGASSIYSLLNGSIGYFRDKYSESDYPSEEVEHMARTLGVGSIVYNDIRRDKKSPVPISADIRQACEQFEEAGGAYVIYTTCRAKSILRKYGADVSAIPRESLDRLGDEEMPIVKKIAEFPSVIKTAWANHDPTAVATYVFELCQSFNTYYNSVRILVEPDEAVKAMRLLVVHATSVVIDRALAVCHIETLERM